LRGGIELAKPPGEVTVHQILAAVDPRPRLRANQAEFEERGIRNQLHRRIAGVNDLFAKVFETTTLLELIEPQPHMLSGGSMPPADWPQAMSAVAFTDEVP
jgi:DNA-binding IscR family transcriptional regulator